MSERLEDDSGDLLREVSSALALVRSEAASALAASYKRGFDDGVRAAQAILNETLQKGLGSQLSAAPNFIRQASPNAVAISTKPPALRAARGSIRAFIVSSLKASPDGLTEQDLSRRASELNPDISPRSMGGELRRMRGRLYNLRGGKWMLSEGIFGGRAAAESSLDSTAPATQATEEELGAPATTIAA